MPLLMATSSSWAEDARVLFNSDTCSVLVRLSPSPLCLATADISNHNTYVDPAPDVALFSVDGLYFLTHTWLVRQQILHCSHPYVLLALSEQQSPQNNLHKQRNKRKQEGSSTSSNLCGQKNSCIQNELSLSHVNRATGYASQHILCPSLSQDKVGRATERASSVKMGGWWRCVAD